MTIIKYILTYITVWALGTLALAYGSRITMRRLITIKKKPHQTKIHPTIIMTTVLATLPITPIYTKMFINHASTITTLQAWVLLLTIPPFVASICRSWTLWYKNKPQTTKSMWYIAAATCLVGLVELPFVL